MKAFYNLPEQVIFCSQCVMSNQRPASTPEFLHTRNRDGAKYLQIDENGICDACHHSAIKENVDWKEREDELITLLDKFRRNDGRYDCLVPGSGGKDSVFQSHILKYKYGMNPLTCTWPPALYTDYGYQNFKNWIQIGGFDNLSFNQNGKVMRLLTRLSIENLLHPFQTFILGQKNFAPRLAADLGINLVFYGENEAEYGNPLADNTSSLRDKSYYAMENMDSIYLGGQTISKILGNNDLSLADLSSFIPAPHDFFSEKEIEIHYLGYYLKWVPQEAYYYAVENTNFKARPFRTQGTYSKYTSIDDKIDDLHFYTTFIKFGIGRATYDASQEIRNKHITREEGQALVSRFDGEFPDKYFDEIMDYIGMDANYFHQLCDEFRSPHLWAEENGQWKLRHTVNNDGTDD